MRSRLRSLPSRTLFDESVDNCTCTEFQAVWEIMRRLFRTLRLRERLGYSFPCLNLCYGRGPGDGLASVAAGPDEPAEPARVRRAIRRATRRGPEPRPARLARSTAERTVQLVEVEEPGAGLP